MIQNPCLRARVFWNKGKKYLFSIKPTEIRYGRYLSLRSGGSDNYRFSPRLHGSFLSGRIFNPYNPFTRNRAISLQIAVLFTPVRLIKQRRITRLQAFTAQTVPKLARLRSAYHFLRKFRRKISDKWYWTWKQKEEWVRVVPFAKHQITSGPGLKQTTFRLTSKPGTG